MIYKTGRTNPIIMLMILKSFPKDTLINVPTKLNPATNAPIMMHALDFSGLAQYLIPEIPAISCIIALTKIRTLANIKTPADVSSKDATVPTLMIARTPAINPILPPIIIKIPVTFKKFFPFIIFPPFRNSLDTIDDFFNYIVCTTKQSVATPYSNEGRKYINFDIFYLNMVGKRVVYDELKKYIGNYNILKPHFYL